MRSNYQLNEQLLARLKQYLLEDDQVQKDLRSYLKAAKVQLRSAVAIDIKGHPKLLFIYNEFQKLKDIAEQHLARKEQLLYPFLHELVHDEEPGLVANGKAVASFLKVFSTENDRIIALLESLDKATGNYATEVIFPPSLKQAFAALALLSEEIKKVSEKENGLFAEILQSQKHSIISNIRRA